MFGESDSESPRVPSPWDSLTSTPPTPPVNDDAFTKGIPRLVPEADEGNVEYKLHLLSPTPARFDRLVTQLKWRLLEGGGQAYYELGVSDSGALVGLSRQQLEESLLTLDMMAGEIDASVIVVKEIEVPPELSRIAESQLGEKWDGRKRARRKDLLRMIEQDSSPSTSTTEFETELSTMDVTDAEENSNFIATSPPMNAGDTLHIPSESSPMPCYSALAIFTKDGDDDVANFADNEAPDERTTDSLTESIVNLEISFVYKPRPRRRRPNHVTFPPPNRHDKRRQYTKKMLKNGFPPSNSIENNPAADGTYYSGAPKAQHRRDRRDKGRRLETNALLTRVPTHNSNKSVDDSTQHPTLFPSSTAEAISLVSDLGSLHVTVIEPLSCVPPIDDTAEHEDVDGRRGTTAVAAQEPRLIVEALVVMKLSVEEAFLDFEAFSL